MDLNALNRISYGLYVLSVRLGDKDNGCIVNTVTQVTSSPTRIAVTVNKQNLTHDVLLHTGSFNVSVISESAKFALFKRFGFQSGRDADKFDGLSGARRAANQIAYITEGICAYLSAKVISSVDLGTHTLFIAEVTECEVLSEDAPMTYAYYHANVKPKPEESPAAKGFRCKICGYIYEGEELPPDFICPWCKHGVEDFEKI
ncbi:MAG: flavin reductase [Clostridia bacterium]|nr:flavin reductase [Clostridia bacterium]MBQ1555807.1 flavin reductase [Clostridia bacterium]MBQ4396987.1 flavin reductase [Clostridia bacterium]